MGTWLTKVRNVLLVLTPKWVSQILEMGLLRTFMVIVAVLVILPPCLLVLAGYWFSVLGRSDLTLAKALRASALGMIHQGLSTEEIAARSNVRLDYLQWFELKLTPKTHPSRDLRLSLKPGQKAVIDFRVIKLIAEAASCTLPEDEMELFTVFIGDEKVRTLRADSNVSVSIDRNWWEEHGRRLNEEDVLQRLSFRLTDQARQLTCGEVALDGGIQVFKDVYSIRRGGTE
jgi:hypothetical protein